MDALRNLPTDGPRKLAELIDIAPGRVVSMAMSRREGCQMTMLAFGEGESVSEECYFGDTLYVVPGGGLAVSVGGVVHELAEGDCMAVPAGTEHAVAARGGCKLWQITLM